MTGPSFCGKCGRNDHSRAQCPLGAYVCPNCKQPGHGYVACPKPRGFSRRPNGNSNSNQICGTCQRPGHAAHNCPELYSARQPARCVTCGSQDHAKTSCPFGQPGRNYSSSYYGGSGNTSGNSKPSNGPSATGTRGKPAPAPPDLATDPSESNKLGILAHSQKKYTAAIEHHTRAIGLNPSEAAYHTNRAASYLNLKDFRGAIADYRRAISLPTFKPSAKTYTRLGQCHLAVGSTKDALIAVHKAFELEPAHEAAEELKATIQALCRHLDEFHSARAQDDWPKAQTAYTRCRQVIHEQGGTLPIEWRCWGIELEIAKGEWDAATGSVSEALTLDPQSAEVLVLRSLIYLLTTKLPEALEQVLAALRLDPDNAKAKSMRVRIKTLIAQKEEGNQFYRENYWDQAVERYGDALETLGGRQSEAGGGQMRATLLNNRAMSLMKLDRLREAMHDANASISLWPLYHKALRVRGRIHIQRGNYEAAAEDFKRSLKEAVAGGQWSEAEIQALRQEELSAEEKARAKI